MPVPAWFRETLERELSNVVVLSDLQMGQLYEHYALLERWNKKMNLTTVEAGPQTVIRHYCESLFFAAHLTVQPGSIVDIGSGAGFPGFPVAVLKAESAVTLVESHQRKAVFLRESSRHLKNVTVLAKRGEDVTGTFEWLVSRAVNPQEILKLTPKMAPRIGLMLGEDDFVAVQNAKHVAWSEPIRLPWGDRRLCVYGECRA